MKLARALALALVALALALVPVASARAATGDVPSVSLRPASTTISDPNHGQWFVADAQPGQTVRMRVVVTNTATVSQHVSLYLADLAIAGDGTPRIGAREGGVGAWGTFDQPSMDIPARAERTVAFRAEVPQGADPGDHLGAVVAEGAPEGSGAVRVVKRVASRLYLTVPGRARAGLAVDTVSVTPERVLAPRWANVVVLVRNTGNVRLRPDVRVGTARARGSVRLMSRSQERYVARVRLPVLGGPASFRAVAVASAQGGRRVHDEGTARTFVLPFPLLLIVALLVLGALTVRLQLRLTR